MGVTGAPSPASPSRPARRRRAAALVAAAALAAGGLGAGLALALGGSSQGVVSSYGYFRSVVGRYAAGPMMGGPTGWTTGRSGYGWMMGGARAPGWMRGGRLPGPMMGGATDPGTVMGRLFADAPGPRVSPSEATRLGNAVPSGAIRDRAANRLAFATTSVRLVVVASPSMPAERFRIAGMEDPTVVVPAGAHVHVELVNADKDMAHGLVVTPSGASSSWMPMATAAPAFPGAALWFLGEESPAGMHAGAFSFRAASPGTYEYLCPVPGHAQQGMAGTFVVGATG